MQFAEAEIDEIERRTGRTGGGGNRRGAGLVVGLRHFAPQDRIDLAVGDQREAQNAATRTDRRQEATDAMGPAMEVEGLEEGGEL